LPETSKPPEGRGTPTLDTDAPKTVKPEERVGTKVRWEKKTVFQPEEFVEDAELEA